MIDISKELIAVMKKEIFNDSDLQNHSAKLVFGELKTKFKDIKDAITAEMQYRLLKKMSNDRQTSIDQFTEAGRADLLEKENAEKAIIDSLMKELEGELPKQLSEEEVASLIASKAFSCIGECMKWFRENYPSQDKKMISMIFNKR